MDGWLDGWGSFFSFPIPIPTAISYYYYYISRVEFSSSCWSHGLSLSSVIPTVLHCSLRTAAIHGNILKKKTMGRVCVYLKLHTWSFFSFFFFSPSYCFRIKRQRTATVASIPCHPIPLPGKYKPNRTSTNFDDERISHEDWKKKENPRHHCATMETDNGTSTNVRRILAPTRPTHQQQRLYFLLFNG